MTPVEPELCEQLLDAIRGTKWTRADELWLQVNEKQIFSTDFHDPVIRLLLRKKHQERLRDMYLLLFEQGLHNGHAEPSCRLIELMLSAESTLEFLRKPLITTLVAVHSDQPSEKVREYCLVSGLDGEAPDLLKCLARFEELLGATRGQVFHHHRWGLGIVVSLDSATSKVIIDFTSQKGKELTLSGVREYLMRLPKDHVLTLIAKEPERAKAMAKEDSAGLLRIALRSYSGVMKAADLKRLLTTHLLTEAEYRSWWNNVRDKIKVDQWLDMRGSGTHAELFLRSEPRSFIDSVTQQLIKPKNIQELRGALRDVRRHGDKAEVSEDDLAKVYDLFSAPVIAGNVKDQSELLNRSFMFLEFSDLFPERQNPIPPEQVLAGMETGDAVQMLAIPELRKELLEALRRMHADNWPAHFVEAFPHLDRGTASWAEKELRRLDSKDPWLHALESVIDRPDRNPDLFLWLAKGIFDGAFDLGTSRPPLILLIEELLSVLDLAWEEANAEGATETAEAKSMISKVRSFLQEGQNKYLRSAVTAASTEEARRLLTQIHLHNALAGPFKHNAERLILMEHPRLKKVSRQEVEEERRKPTHHYTIEASVHRKRQELSDILNKEIPANSIAIGTARELGDLKENAEYHAAKDRQRLLMQTAAELEELIARARVIEPGEVNTDQVRFGTKVKLRTNASGAVREITMLGMWEADQGRGIISYMTPFGSQLLNRKLDEVFTITTPDGLTEEYTVLAIEKAI